MRIWCRWVGYGNWRLSETRWSSLAFRTAIQHFCALRPAEVSFLCVNSSTLRLVFHLLFSCLSSCLLLSSFSVSVCLSIRVLFCVVAAAAVVVCVSWCVWCVWCDILEKTPRVYVQNVPMCTGTTPASVTTCGRGAGTHGDVFSTDTAERERVIVSSAYQNLPTQGYHVTQRFTKSNHWILQVSCLRIGREHHVPDSSNHTLYLMKLFVLAVCPEGNKLLDCSIRFSLLSPSIPNDLHVSSASPPGFLLTLPFSSFVHHYTQQHTTTRNKTQHTTNKHTHRHKYTYKYTHIYVHFQ